MNKKLTITTIVGLTNLLVSNNAQIQDIEKPKSFEYNLKKPTEVPMVKTPDINYETIINEEKQKNRYGSTKPLTFAKCFDVFYSPKNSGVWETLPNGDKIWRLKIVSTKAKAISLILSNFELSEGCKLFVYSQDTSKIIGAITSKNNNDNKILVISPVHGDTVFIEYYEPKGLKENCKFFISSICHDYRGLFNTTKTKDDGGWYGYGHSGDCEIDINCPEGANWQNEKRAVCRIIFRDENNYLSLCTGALLNNTNHDGRAFVLTANHCICNNSRAAQSIFYFNYESPICNGADGSTTQTISGATLRAHFANSDFSLVELNSIPPNDYNVYYLGWNRNNNPPMIPVHCIHHPMGDVKKISFSNLSISNQFVNFYGSYCDLDVIKDTWNVPEWQVGITGRVGVTEQGSSGSPLLDNMHRVVGQLYGGESYCGYPFNDYYGRFSTSWTGGGTDATRLQNWLDPTNRVTELPGLRLIQNMTITSNTPASGDIVRLINVSIQNGSNITIDFNNQFEATGTFDAPLGTTLNIHP